MNKNSDKHFVIYKNETITRINPQLVSKQQISDDELEIIKNLHIQRFLIEKSFISGDIDATNYREAWAINQFSLQQAWKFSKDKNFHVFTSMQGCSCPSMNNYPYGPYSYSKTCRVHGEITK
ncbi:hypothetical protein GW796_08665 [archaeon]|nr:hypothetical protein [archaeon]NCQ51951.1 hypothetical protein [archaeon]